MERPRRPLHSQDNYIYPQETSREYKKFVWVIFGCLAVSLILTIGRGWNIKYLWEDFIAVLIILSAGYKMFRLEVFTSIFQSYDYVARRWKIWSYFYPFIELAIGADYLFSNGSKGLYFITIVFMGLTIYGIIEQPRNRSHVQYACLDNIIRLPLATVSLIESIIVAVFALVMAIFY